MGKLVRDLCAVDDEASSVRRDIERASAVYSALRGRRPNRREELRDYVKVFLGMNVPNKSICRGHSSPMDYLWQSFSEDYDRAKAGSGDVVVWANRGGGKTRLAAVVTLLDCVFKPRCQVRILGGSREQAGRMYEYLEDFLQGGFESYVDGAVRRNKCRFVNGSRVEVLTQSSRSVRGHHVQRLRCDEVDLFDAKVLRAAKFVTKSADGIGGRMEMISTMHRPYGLMQEVVSSAAEGGRRVFKWCVWEVIERCVGRNCSQCGLWSDCGGKAKEAVGYLGIEDCLAAIRRSSRAGWEAEMLCLKPNLENAVFGEFDSDEHVVEVSYDANLPLYRSFDFGFVNPFVCLWIQVDGDGMVRVIDEYVRSRATVDAHAAVIKERTPCREKQVSGTFCDPAGAGVNDVTGTSVVRELRGLGIVARYRRSGIIEGIELIRRAVRAGDGQSRLRISPRCFRLIEAFRCYHYPEQGSVGQKNELPLKDGIYDHPIDALRYFFVNYKRSNKISSRRY